MRAAPSLARYSAVACLLLILYASLHPVSNWSQAAAPLLAYLDAPWPRYYTVFDLAVNVIGYLPAGFLLVAARPRRLPRPAAAIGAILLATGVSFAVETLQNFLPDRVPSNVDLGANVLGALLGALLGLRWGDQLTDGGRLHAWRMRIFLPGRAADMGMILVGAWLLAQCNPDALPFATGDLRRVLGIEPSAPYSVERFFAIEFGVAFASVVAGGLLAATLVRGTRIWPVVILLGAAFAVKAIASGLLVSPGRYAYWVTAGSSAGTGAGTIAVLAAMRAPAALKRSIAAVALLFGTALVNMSPENPYVSASLALWREGPFFNFNGLTRLVGSLWPFAALTFLMSGQPRGERRRTAHRPAATHPSAIERPLHEPVEH